MSTMHLACSAELRITRDAATRPFPQIKCAITQDEHNTPGMQGPLTMMDAFCGVGKCSKAAQLLSEASAQAAAALQPAGPPAAPGAFDVRLLFIFLSSAADCDSQQEDFS